MKKACGTLRRAAGDSEGVASASSPHHAVCDTERRSALRRQPGTDSDRRSRRRGKRHAPARETTARLAGRESPPPIPDTVPAPCTARMRARHGPSTPDLPASRAKKRKVNATTRTFGAPDRGAFLPATPASQKSVRRRQNGRKKPRPRGQPLPPERVES